MESISIIIGIASLSLAIWSLVQAKKSFKQSNENAEGLVELFSQSQGHLQDIASLTIRYQVIKNHLRDKNNNEKYKQDFLDLCRDEFDAHKKGVISKEMLTICIDTACKIVKKDPSFLIVWKKHAQNYEQDFISFFDNEVFRKVGII